MDAQDNRRAHLARCLILVGTLAICNGCAMWPTAALNGSENETTLAKTALAPSGAKCSDTPSLAKACANAALSMAHALETHAGGWDRGYSYLMVGLGIWGATALKSDSGRDQLLEDLAVAVGALAGLRTVVRPEEQRAIAEKGRDALRCALGAAEDLERAAAARPSGNANTAEGKAAAQRARTSANIAAYVTGTAAERSAKIQDLINTENLAIALEAAALRARSRDFAGNLDSALYEAFTSSKGFTSKGLDVNSEAPAHVAFAAGAAKLRASMVAIAAERANSALADEHQNMRFALTDAVIKILHDMASALSKPVAGINDLANTQRESVTNLIGESARAAEKQQAELQNLVASLSGVSGVSVSNLINVADASSLGNTPASTPLKKRLEECAFEDPSASPTKP